MNQELHEFSRTELLLGGEAIERLSKSRAAVFGIGGVGSYAAEALARSGVGSLCLIDHDEVSLTNLNRQLIATHATIGKKKVDAARERILSINPQCQVETYPVFYGEETCREIPLESFDYVLDAIDSVPSKVLLAAECQRLGVPLISCMGAGNKLDASKLQVADLFQTEMCPLAKVMRRELRQRGIQKLKVVYSAEPPLSPAPTDEPSGKRRTPGSVAWVPSAAGLMMAGEAILTLAGWERPDERGK